MISALVSSILQSNEILHKPTVHKKRIVVPPKAGLSDLERPDEKKLLKLHVTNWSNITTSKLRNSRRILLSYYLINTFN